MRLDGENGFAALPEPGSEHRMGQVGTSILQAGHGVGAGDGALSEPRNLWEDEPYPVAPLPPGVELGECLPEDLAVLLRQHEAFEIRSGHDDPPVGAASSASLRLARRANSSPPRS